MEHCYALSPTEREPLLPKQFKRPLHPLLVIAVLVELLYITKGLLLITRYLYPPVCSNATYNSLVEGDDSPELHRDEEYYFTVGVYAICSFIRCLEYIPIFIGLYQFFNSKKSSNKVAHPYNPIWLLLVPINPADSFFWNNT